MLGKKDFCKHMWEKQFGNKRFRKSDVCEKMLQIIRQKIDFGTTISRNEFVEKILKNIGEQSIWKTILNRKKEKPLFVFFLVSEATS